MTNNEISPLRMIGAFAPSTGRLADAMTKFVTASSVTNILEVGAGTGAITKSLAGKLTPSQHVDVVEIFPQFVKLLHKRFGHNPQISIHGQDILHFDTSKSYDLIISGLPFNAFLPHMTDAIINRLINLAKPGAFVSFFEYTILHGMMPYVMPKKKFAEFLGSRVFIENFVAQYQFEEKVVHFNIPPACVHHLCIKKENI